MKPVTVFEKHIVELNKKLPSLEDEVLEWAKEAAVPHGAIRHKNNVVVCAHCKNAMPFDPGKSSAVCIECGRVVRIVDSDTWKRIRGTFKGWFSTLSVIDGIQLQRTWELKCRYYLDGREPKYSWREICRHWRVPDGTSAVTALPRVMGQVVDCFPFKGSIELRKTSRMVYDFIANNAAVYPSMELLPVYSCPNFHELMHTMGVQAAMAHSPHSPLSEKEIAFS